MTLGIWKNYDELEESLTLDELLELYREVVSSEARRTNNTAKAFGAEVEMDLGLAEDGKLDEDESREDVFSSITDRVSEKLGRSIVKEEDEARNYRNMKMGYRRISQ